MFYDVIFIQKALLPEAFITLLKLMRRQLVFDFDDAVYTVPPSIESAVSSMAKDKISRRFRHTVALSNLVVLENEHTKQYAGKYNSNIFMITGPIDTVRYFPPKQRIKNNSVVIGWIGSQDTSHYLMPLFPVFHKLHADYPFVCFKFIGALPLDLQGVRIRQVPWSMETEASELQEFDIGIMPLSDDEWSRAKGGYKILQYMAAGISSVASPVGINTEIIEEKVNGLLATYEEEWYEKLRMLITDENLRLRMGANARKIAEEKYSFFVAVEKLLGALESLHVKT